MNPKELYKNLISNLVKQYKMAEDQAHKFADLMARQGKLMLSSSYIVVDIEEKDILKFLKK